MANSKINLIQYLQSILGALALTFCAYCLELRFGGENKGLIMGAIEVALEFYMVFQIFRLRNDQKTRYYFLGSFLFFLGIGDFFYVLLYYGFHVSSRTFLSSSLTTLMYTIGYFTGAIAFVLWSDSPKKWLRQKTNYVIYLLCLPIALRLLVLPFVSSAVSTGSTYFKILEISAIVGTLFLLAHGIITLVISRTLFWTNIGVGTLVLVVSDWSLRVEKLVDDAPAFGFYEVLYCFGIATIATSFRKVTHIEKIELFDSSSLISRTKAFSMMAIFISVLFLSLSQYGTRDSIRFASVGCIFGAFLAFFFSFYLLKEISRVTELTRKLTSQGDESAKLFKFDEIAIPAELKDIVDETYALHVQAIQEKNSLEQKIDLQKELLNFSSQVSHDIKSPLAALEMMLSSAEGFSEDARLITRNALNRIKDIANDLRQKDRKELSWSNEAVLNSFSSFSTTMLIAPLIEEIVSEKRIQFRERMNLSIEFDERIQNYGLFADVNGVEFKRALSNLINNSVEAIESGQGFVRVFLSMNPDETKIQIKISDNGVGIEPEILKKIGIRGNTFGKNQGSGLGLFHAMTAFASWDGALSIKSTAFPASGHGTTILMELPRKKAPSWFVPVLQIHPQTTVVVLDDDLSIHNVWDSRVGSLVNQENGITVEHFTSASLFKDFFRKAFLLRDKFIFLLDYEILDQNESGLDLIEKLGIAEHSILVTSHYDEQNVRARCESLNVKLIPKSMAGFVPIDLGCPAVPGLAFVAEKEDRFETAALKD